MMFFKQTDNSKRIKEIKKRLSEASNNWNATGHAHIEDGCRCMSCYEPSTLWWTANMIECPDCLEEEGYSFADVTFIENAKEDIKFLLGLI